MKNAIPKLELIASYAIFGTLGVFRKYVPLNSGLLCVFRGLIGAAVLLLFMLIKKQKADIKGIKNNIGKLVISGTAIGINWVLLFEAYKYTTVAVASLCYYMAPIFVLIAASPILKEKTSRTSMLCIGIAVAGMFMVSLPGLNSINKTQLIGIGLSLLAAVFYSCDVICNKMMPDIDALDKTAVQLLVAGLVIIPYAVFAEPHSACEITFIVVAFVAIMGVVHTGLAFVLAFDGITKLNTQTVAVFTYIDPVLSVLLSAVLLKEQITVFTLIGAVCILGSALYNELKSK